MRKIIVASDLSERSDRAIDRAVVLARQFDLPLKIVHVVDADLPSSLADSIRNYAELHLNNCLAALPQAVHAQVTIEIILGHDYKEILRIAEDEDAEVIVLGCHRQPSTTDRFLGTVAERVIREGHRPVLVVKKAAESPYRKVLVCVDFSLQSHRAMRYGSDFVPDGRFYFVHAYQIPFHGFMRGKATHNQVRTMHEERIRSVVRKEMDAFGTSAAPFHTQVERIIEEGPPVEVISRQIGRIKPDLIVAGTHGRTGVAHMMLGSVAEELLRDPPCDILVVKSW